MKAKLTQLFSRINHRGFKGTLVYFLGRFHAARLMHSWINRAFLFRNGAFEYPNHDSGEMLVSRFDMNQALRSLRMQSVFTSIKLTPRALGLIQKEISKATRFEAHGAWEQVNDAMLLRHLESNDQVLIVDYQSEPLAKACRLVAKDPQLMALATQFLGKPPAKTGIRIQQSLVAEASIDFRESKNQTVKFHYDVDAIGFLYVFFYLSETTASSGAHELMRGTHRGKRLRHLFNSAKADDDDVYLAYGKERALIIEGNAGSGFVEDTSCFHRALPPKTAPRLALQIRYS